MTPKEEKKIREEAKKYFGVKPTIMVPYEQRYFSPDMDKIIDFVLARFREREGEITTQIRNDLETYKSYYNPIEDTFNQGKHAAINDFLNLRLPHILAQSVQPKEQPSECPCDDGNAMVKSHIESCKYFTPSKSEQPSELSQCCGGTLEKYGKMFTHDCNLHCSKCGKEFIPRQEKESVDLKLCSTCHTMKHIAEGTVCERCKKEYNLSFRNANDAEVANKEPWWSEEFEKFLPYTPSYLKPEDAKRMDKELKDFISSIEQKTRESVIDEAIEILKLKIEWGVKSGSYNQGLVDSINALKELKQ